MYYLIFTQSEYYYSYYGHRKLLFCTKFAMIKTIFSCLGIVGMPKGCKGDYQNEGRYKFGHGSGILMQLCDPSCQ